MFESLDVRRMWDVGTKLVLLCNVLNIRGLDSQDWMCITNAWPSTRPQLGILHGIGIK